MANWGYLLGGAVVGAAGLYTAVNAFSRKDEEQNSLRSYTASQCPLDAEAAERLSVNEVQRHLSNYEQAGMKLHMKCSLICADSIEYQDIPLVTPYDGIWDKFKIALCGQITKTGRPWMLESLVKVRKNLVQLYLSYHPVFLRANALLLENGGQAVNLKGLTLKGVTLQVNHALSNEDWGLDFGRQADKLRDFIDKTVDAAAALKGQLNLLKDQQDLLTNAGQ